MASQAGTSDRLLTLVSSLYDATERTEGWRAFLEKLCAELGGSAASFISLDFHSARVQISETVRTAPEALRAYNERWHAEDPWAHSPSTATLEASRVVVGEELIDRGSLHRTGFYNEFGRHHDLAQDLAAIVEVGPDRRACLSINGSAHRAPFGSSEVAVLQALMPHLRNALQLHRRLAAAEAMSSDFLSALDRLRHGVILTTAAGRVGHVNRAAQMILDARDGLVVDARELRATRARDTATIREAIRSAAAVRVRTTSSGRRFTINRPSGRAAYVVLVAPAIRQVIDLLDQESLAVMVVLTDPSRFVAPSPARLCAALGVTATEARVAILLLGGASTERIASTLRVGVSTVRTHFRHLFAKTGTASQADLVRVLMTVTEPVVE